MSKLAFYASSGDNPENTALTYNGQNTDNTLCFKVYGGDKDHWWHGLITFVFLYVMAIIWRLYAVERSGNSIKNDTAIQAMLLGAVTFLLLFTFAFNGPFIDENDNLRGGLVIANGGVLYRDYITQHTPVVYYLCSIFALLGADSVAQFRISYYILEAAVWMFLYIRHKDHFGKRGWPCFLCWNVFVLHIHCFPPGIPNII